MQENPPDQNYEADAASYQWVRDEAPWEGFPDPPTNSDHESKIIDREELAVMLDTVRDRIVEEEIEREVHLDHVAGLLEIAAKEAVEAFRARPVGTGHRHCRSEARGRHIAMKSSRSDE